MPYAILLFSLALAVLIFWYFASDDDTTKRWVGTGLSVGVTIFCLLGIFPPNKLGGLLSGQKSLAESHGLKPGIDIAGGSSFVLKLQKVEGQAIGPQQVDQAIGVIRDRLNAMGNADMIISPHGSDRILLQMPGVEEGNRESIRIQLQKAAKLDFHLVHPNSHALVDQVESTGIDEPGYLLKVLKHKDKLGNVLSEEKILITSRSDLKGTFVSGAIAVNDPQAGWITSIGFDDEGRKQFGELTSNNVGRQLAVVLDGEVVSAPSIETAIMNGNAQVSGMGTQRAAEELASALQNPLEAPMIIDQEQSVSASLGADAVKQGILSGVVGMLITVIFLIFYYRLAGLIAFVGLMVNMVVLFGVMAVLNFTFTLPGIAGILLTIGMAVDSNVLIYERLKEELAAGKSIGSAIAASYDKAFSAIFDANITTLLSGIVLYYLATDAVRGFAVTLICGIIGTMFAALLVTRVCFRWLIDTKWLKTISIGKPLRDLGINFMGRNRLAGIISVIALVMSFGLMVFKGNDSLGISFKGGSLITLKLTPETAISVPEVEKALTGVQLTKSPVVQEMATPGSPDEILSIRVESGKAPEVINYLRANVPQFQLKDASGNYVVSDNTDTVGPTMGKELLISSAFALLLGLVAILIYLAFRFEFSFALGAIIAVIHDLIITVGIMLLFGREMTEVMVGSLLTIAGYSVNDTIVVFDRIRENLKAQPEGGNIRVIINEALNSTLSRTMLTSLTTLFILTFMSIWGGPSLRDFSISLILGIVVGTYSSIFVASSFVVWWSRLRGKSLHEEVAETTARISTPGVG